ncbi:MAG: hypothetical protein ACPKM0_09850 [Pleomorphochaeta sp.]
MKKLLSTLLVATIAITGLFAYSSPSIILDATAEQTDYTFKLQRLNDSMTSIAGNYTSDYTEDITLTSEEQTTNAFTVATTAIGNMPSDIGFTTTITTGAFLDANGDSDYNTSWYPTIVELSDSATTTNESDSKGEVVSFKSSASGKFIAQSVGVFSTTFERGVHLLGAEIARFKLSYKADDELAAGTYTSTTTIAIATN